MILAGDIGGTKTHLALFEKGKILKEEKYASKEFAGLEEILFLFLKKSDSPKKACFGIAGPIRNGRCQATNLPWMINAKELEQKLKIDAIFLINDLEANAYGIKCLSSQEFYPLNEGSSDSLGNQVLISAGTGLGEAGLYWDGEKHHPFACEGGHADFSPQSELDMELLRYLRKKFGHVSCERILSGPGIYQLYRFLIDLRLEAPSEDFGEVDPAQVITERALKKECKTCVRTLKWFTMLYGAEAGNLALKMFSVGGVYIGGGIAPKILPALKTGDFMKAFIDKGRFSTLLSQISVKVILNQNTALLGAERYAEEQ
ncbi:MAG: glucokinase [Chlamydiota bacterium]